MDLAMFGVASTLAFGVAAAATPIHLDTANYTYWCIGSCDRDASVTPHPGLILMGGGTDVDSAFQQHIKWSAGGDFLVLRASGDDAYNSYIQGLGSTHSVATLLTKNRAAAEDPFVLSKIDGADAIWFAGGDQSVYLDEWQASTMQQRLQAAIARGVPVGGTSAGCDIQGGSVYTGANGSATSDEALADPYNKYMTLQPYAFLKHSPPAGLLANIIVDTHFMTRDRFGRLLALAARLWKDDELPRAAVGIDEKTAIAIDSTGKGTMHMQGSAGGRAWVLTPTTMPERCEKGRTLVWETSVQKLDAKYGDTYNFMNMSGGAPSQKYTVSASDGALKPGDPYSPPRRASRADEEGTTRPDVVGQQEAEHLSEGVRDRLAYQYDPPLCDWCEGGACNPQCGVVKDLFNVSITPAVGRAFPYWRSPTAAPLGVHDEDITLGVIVHHGVARNGNDYFCSMYNGLLKRFGAEARHVFLASPQIYEPSDGPASTELYWEDDDTAERNWKWGGNSSAALSASISSFSVLDEMLHAMMDQRTYPNLKALVVTGHSAGGQIVQRFALASSFEPRSGVTLGYFPANPSSYTYLNDLRPVIDAPWTCSGFCDNTTILSQRWDFAKPQGTKGTCDDYNAYGYGFDGALPDYLAARGVEAMRAAYGNRTVTYLSGESDVCDHPFQTEQRCTPGCDPQDGGLDTSCEAALQGHCRMARAHAFAQYVQHVYAGAPLDHRLVSVPHVGHNGCAMFQSPEAIAAMFP